MTSGPFDLKWWVQNWQRVGPELERIEWEELRNLSPEDHLAAVGAVLELADPSVVSGTSGLVEQQRLFGKARAS